MAMGGMAMQQHPASETGNPLVDMQTMAPTPKLEDPGIGLRDNGRTVLSYAMLRSAFEDPDGRDPGREVELHLTGHLEKFAGGFNGQKFSDAPPLRINYGERLRIELVHDSLQTPPTHLPEMCIEPDDDQSNVHIRPHTNNMQHGQKSSPH